MSGRGSIVSMVKASPYLRMGLPDVGDAEPSVIPQGEEPLVEPLLLGVFRIDELVEALRARFITSLPMRAMNGSTASQRSVKPGGRAPSEAW